MGEGSSNQGDVHEALNFAAIHRLPFVFLVENNGYAISVPAAKELAIPDVMERASLRRHIRVGQAATFRVDAFPTAS